MTLQDPALEKARKRAKELREFYGHLTTYLVVCTMLVVIDLVSTGAAAETILGLRWAFWPILGWGVFVAIHAANTFFGFSGRWEDRKVDELYEKEKYRDLIHH